MRLVFTGLALLPMIHSIFPSLLLSLLLLASSSSVDAFSTSTTTSSSSPSYSTPRRITPGSKIPNVDLHWGFNPVAKVNIPEYIADQNVLIIGVPGAFNPTETEIQIPTFFERQEVFREELGIDNIIVYSVNDSAVVGIWNKYLVEMHASGGDGGIITFLGDPDGSFTRACGMEITDPKPTINKGLVKRCKRFALYVVNNVIQTVIVSESYGDPTGDRNPKPTCANAIIQAIKNNNSSPNF